MPPLNFYWKIVYVSSQCKGLSSSIVLVSVYPQCAPNLSHRSIQRLHISEPLSSGFTFSRHYYFFWNVGRIHWIPKWLIEKPCYESKWYFPFRNVRQTLRSGIFNLHLISIKSFLLIALKIFPYIMYVSPAYKW